LKHHKNVELSRRIAHVEGRVKAIRKMIEEKTYLETVQQISAVRSAKKQSVNIIFINSQQRMKEELSMESI